MRYESNAVSRVLHDVMVAALTAVAIIALVLHNGLTAVLAAAVLVTLLVWHGLQASRQRSRRNGRRGWGMVLVAGVSVLFLAPLIIALHPSAVTYALCAVILAGGGIAISTALVGLSDVRAEEQWRATQEHWKREEGLLAALTRERREPDLSAGRSRRVAGGRAGLHVCEPASSEVDHSSDGA